MTERLGDERRDEGSLFLRNHPLEVYLNGTNQAYRVSGLGHKRILVLTYMCLVDRVNGISGGRCHGSIRLASTCPQAVAQIHIEKSERLVLYCAKAGCSILKGRPADGDECIYAGSWAGGRDKLL